MPVVFRGSERYVAPDPGPVVTIGNFDGVHLGHRALVNAARAMAGDHTVCVYTFDPPPRDVMAPGNGVPAIQSLDDRLALLGQVGVDHVVVETFTKAYAAHSAEDFCDAFLGRRLRASGVVIGWDFRFGRGRLGDADVLRARLGVPVVQVAGVQVDGEVVSSTRVRKAVRDADMALAERLLGRPHVLAGQVVRGDQRGRTIGFPTANVDVVTELQPRAGVYAVRVALDGRRYDGVANLGVRPTFGPARAPLEVHLFDFEGDLYGRRIEVSLIDRLRDERAFDGVEALVAQIRLDADAARALLATHP